MVDFEHKTRERCRHCKMTLPEPLENEREAFCTKVVLSELLSAQVSCLREAY
jgi:hypothetical protein